VKSHRRHTGHEMANIEKFPVRKRPDSDAK
jgi:hypothetical protein